MSDGRPGHLSDLRIPALDGIRGLAILLVVPHNASLLLDANLHGVGYPVKELMLLGWIGVQLFFVLSGFLISGALLDTQDAPNYYQSFYARRALRILPLYYGVLIVTFLVLAPLQLLPAEMLAAQPHQVWLWTFLSNWADPHGQGILGFDHYWSLAVEEQFYLLWPLLLHRMAPRRVLTLCVTICVAALAIRIWMRAQDYPPEYLYEFTVSRMDALAMGAAAAAMLRLPDWRERLARMRPHLPWLAAGLYVVCMVPTHDYQRTGWATQTWGMSALAVSFTLFVLAAAGTADAPPNWFSRALSFGPLRSLGKYSFGMYVFHFPLTKIVGLRLLGPAAATPSVTLGVAYSLAITVASYCIAWVSFHVFEQRFLKLKRHFRPEAVATQVEAA